MCGIVVGVVWQSTWFVDGSCNRMNVACMGLRSWVAAAFGTQGVSWRVGGWGWCVLDFVGGKDVRASEVWSLRADISVAKLLLGHSDS